MVAGEGGDAVLAQRDAMADPVLDLGPARGERDIRIEVENAVRFRIGPVEDLTHPIWLVLGEVARCFQGTKWSVMPSHSMVSSVAQSGSGPR